MWSSLRVQMRIRDYRAPERKDMVSSDVLFPSRTVLIPLNVMLQKRILTVEATGHDGRIVLIL